MTIVDSQVHIWASGTPSPHHRQEPFGAGELLAAMEDAGVDRAILVPPTWDPDAPAIALAAARTYPDSFGVMGGLPLLEPSSREAIVHWREQPGALGLRFSFNSPQTRATLSDGRADWVWPAAEEAGLPIMVLAPGQLEAIGIIAQRHPHLKIIIDHLGIPRGLKDEEAFAHLPTLLALAELPNVAVKAAGIPAYTTRDDYPFVSLHPYLRQTIAAFGAQRVFWGTDLSRMPCSYRRCVTAFTEEMPWLSQDDLDEIMGAALCRWLDWPPALPMRP